ncbi:unnamed protein product [Brachionus calyciflorus]|uniref:Uncharacterized protein n=1 Tax=Brachionus calyciflorus TaxID=104777 RepID=A0A814EMK5_9BILA|nr:unnamed protein product [Brachionus calyciflorus]
MGESSNWCCFGAGIGIGAMKPGPAVLSATILAAGTTVGTATVAGGLIGYYLDSEKVVSEDNQPALQENRNRRRTNEDENRRENTNSNRNSNRNRTKTREDHERHGTNEQSIRTNQRFQEDIELAIALSLSETEQQKKQNSNDEQIKLKKTR